MSNRRHALRHLGVLAAATLATPALVAQELRGRIVLGQSAALTGAAAQLGLQFQAGARLYFARLNTRGGINGRAVELKSLDDGYEPDRCARNTRQLIEEGAAALFGFIGTPTSLAALPIATATSAAVSAVDVSSKPSSWEVPAASWRRAFPMTTRWVFGSSRRNRRTSDIVSSRS